MDLCAGGDLLRLVELADHLAEACARAMFAEIVRAVAECHARGVLHRDLKPENVLLLRPVPDNSSLIELIQGTVIEDTVLGGNNGDSTERKAKGQESCNPRSSDSSLVKLTDFGLSVIEAADRRGAKEVAGSAYYLAPEVFSGRYSFPADVWSLGVVLFVLLSGCVPFGGEDDDEIGEAIREGSFAFDEESGSAWKEVSLQTLLPPSPFALPGEEVPNAHFHKDWQSYVKTWFNQPARKKRRRIARQKKAVSIFPRPTAGPLRPEVHAPSIRYNSKIREGRGFTPAELREAGIPIRVARTIGISVDSRRRNRSLESLQANAARLKAYKAKLVVFPRRSKKPKAGDASAEELAAAVQHVGAVLPIVRPAKDVPLEAVTEELRSVKAYETLRQERTKARLEGIRKKRAADKEKEEKK
ncbi:unnamed protein product [Closterium sp. NIES-65]|nr:unnamed protein product [Closterium sp. NIES-65]